MAAQFCSGNIWELQLYLIPADAQAGKSSNLDIMGSGEMTQNLIAWTFLTEDPSSIPNTQVGQLNNHPYL